MAWAHRTGLDFSDGRLISSPSGESKSSKCVAGLIIIEILKLDMRTEGNGENLRLAKGYVSG